MKIANVLFTIIFIASFCYAQNIDKISHKCSAPDKGYFSNVSVVDSDVTYNPCPSAGKNIFANTTFFSGDVRLVDSSYSNTTFPNLPFSIGHTGNRSITGGFAASVFDNSVIGSGANNYFVSQYSNLAIGGASVTNANIFGYLGFVTNRSNSIQVGSTTTIEGIDIFTNIETPTITGYGVIAYASTGSANAAGTGTISAINGAAGIHLGDATNVNAGEFRIFNAISGNPAIETNAKILRGYVSNNAGNTITNLRGLSFDSFFNAGTITNSTIIYADSSTNVGSGTRYFIDSANTAPSRLAGDVYITDTTKGIILTSPNGSCYRFTVANGGALSAGALVTCP